MQIGAGAVTQTICHINLAREFRGGEHQAELLIRGLHKLGYRQRLIARQGDVLLQRLFDLHESGGVECIGIPPPFIHHLALCRGAGVLQVHEAKGGHMACAANSLYGTPYVLTRRIDKPPQNSFINRRLYRNAARVVAVSATIRQALLGKLVKRNVEVIFDAHTNFEMDADVVGNIRQRFAGKFVIGHAAALVDRHKGQSTLIKAARILREAAPDLQLVFLGSGSDEASLRNAARDMPNVSFEGFSFELQNYLGVMDIFAYPSNYEGLGSVLLDAMHAALPIVASRVGGIPEIISHEHNGLLVEPGNAQALADALLRLYQDAGLRARLAERAQQRAAGHTPAAMARQYAEIYASLGVHPTL